MSVPDTSFNLKGLETLFVSEVEASKVVTNKTLWLPVRLALVDSKISLPAFDIMIALGKDGTLKRLYAFIA
jgi:hypothetical protein